MGPDNKHENKGLIDVHGCFFFSTQTKKAG